MTVELPTQPRIHWKRPKATSGVTAYTVCVQSGLSTLCTRPSSSSIEAVEHEIEHTTLLLISKQLPTQSPLLNLVNINESTKCDFESKLSESLEDMEDYWMPMRW